MKVISVWQPWASLLVHGHKGIETRGWNAPANLIKKRIGIAATKNIVPAQRLAFNDPTFAAFYAETGLPPLDELPRGCVLGSVVLNSSDPIDQELVDDLAPAEYAFGWYDLGRFAWRVRAPQAFGPYAASGKQGIWDWEAPNDLATLTQDNARADQEGPPVLRRTLHPALGQEGVLGAA